jgi:hypothetical protein
MAIEVLTSAPATALAIPGARLTEFEPQGLGPFHARFRRLLMEINGRRQSEIRALLLREERVARNGEAGQHRLAYQVSLLVLRDYVSSGYYPIIHSGRCLLAPVFESTALSPEKRRIALQRTYESARNRALVDRAQAAWIGRAGDALHRGGYDARHLVDALGEEPPRISLEQVTTSRTPADPRGLWRTVRATWSMTPEMSAPGREVAMLVGDARYPGVPLGISQFRNVVPEILARDLWLGISSGGSDGTAGFLALIERQGKDGRERLQQTREQLRRLLGHVHLEGLDGIDRESADPVRLAAIIRGSQQRYRDERAAAMPDAHRHLAVVKRAETVLDLTRGIRALIDALAVDDPVALLRQNARLRRDLDAGLRKLWHYHMGFVAIEMSICGAAPPFGPARLGKLIASLAGSAEVVEAWGRDRPLGEIAAKVFNASVREAMPNPGPLAVFTSGLYPGHSAQYTRVASGATRWRKIGETTGFGSFHIGVDTTRVIEQFNALVDGYAHITRTFGEGSGARFRSVGRALGRLGLPDLLKHETRRPLYVLPLVESPQSVILGWQQVEEVPRPSAQRLTDDWWHRWFEPRQRELLDRARGTPDLPEALDRIAKAIDA